MGFFKNVGNVVKGVGSAVNGIVGGAGDTVGGLGRPAQDPLKAYRDELMAKARTPVQVKTDPAADAMRARFAALAHDTPARIIPIEMENVPGGGPKTYSGPLNEFQQMRDRTSERIRSQGASQSQTNQDALSRRFARMGGLNSGAFIKQTQLAQQASDDAVNSQLQDANASLDLQEAQERQRRNEFEQQRYDALQEAARGRNLSREATNMDISARNTDNAFKQKLMEADNESKLGQLDLAYKNMQLEQDAQQFNKLVAAIEAGNPQGLIGSLFGPGGVPGLRNLPVVGGLFS